MFILASASPRRRALLRQIGASFVSITPAVDEVKDGERPRDAVIRNALMKARKVAEEYPDHAVLGADTAVVLNGMAFGKPKDAEDARHMLSQLEGRQHTVLTGIAWVVDGREYTDAAETTVRFAPMTDAEIAAYVATGEPMGKAGAYAVQGRADSRTCGDLHRGALRLVLECGRAAAPRRCGACTHGGHRDGG